MSVAGQLNLRAWAQSDPSRLAVRCNATDTSYAELEALANQAAHVLRARGIARGDHVAAVLGNDAMIFALVWAAYRVGAYITPIPSASSVEDAAYVVADSGAKLVVVNAALGPAMARLRHLVPGQIAWLSMHGALDGFDPLAPLLQQAPATPVVGESSGALMMYTSGTTGKPKGVWRPLPEKLSATPAFAADLVTMFDVSAGSRYLSTAPLYHAAPLRFGLAFLAAGGSVIVMAKFDAAHALDLLEREGITHSQWVPTMFHRLLALPEERRSAFKAPAHRLALHSAAPCPPALKQAMIDWWGPILEEYYSGSEGVGLTAIASDEWLLRPGSVGRARKGVIHVLNDDDEELPPGNLGRIFFSGIAPFGYHRAGDKTAARTSRQGWQTFGDVGHVDAEGYLFLSDRLDDMIISGGVNIYPQELEAALAECKDLTEAAVIGAPDPDFGERPVAFVVPRVAPADSAAFVAQVAAWCRERLGKIKEPKEIHVVDALPYSAQGKLLRRELRKLL